jgi:nicotinamide-nucleotide amidase
MTPAAIVISIGNELVLGQTVDTNSAWLSRELSSIGCDVIGHLTVGDDQSAIESALADAAGRCDFLLISGGLGPTKDDLTRQALASVLKQPLEMNDAWLARMEAMFRSRNIRMAETNRIQSMIPRQARCLENTAGTAAGIDADFVSPATGRSSRIFVMPGVPSEMRKMFQRDVAPIIAASGAGRTILSRTLHTFGLGESAVGEMLGSLMDRTRNPTVGTTVASGSVSLRITARESTRALAEEKLRESIALCREALGDLIYGEEQDTIASVVAEMLVKGNFRVTTAESCTGGLVAKMLTDIAGSSRYFQRGWVTYSNEAKQEMLGVPEAVIQRHGAVSEEVVTIMARGARENSGADFALAISGIAGPDGGTPAKPVGTVCISLAHDSGELTRTFKFPGDREMVRNRSANMSLTLLRYHLRGKLPPF